MMVLIRGGFLLYRSGTSATESCEGCLLTQFKHLTPQLVLKLYPVTVADPDKFFDWVLSKKAGKKEIFVHFNSILEILTRFQKPYDLVWICHWVRPDHNIHLE